jgi:hypothetical protein
MRRRQMGEEILEGNGLARRGMRLLYDTYIRPCSHA